MVAIPTKLAPHDRLLLVRFLAARPGAAPDPFAFDPAVRFYCPPGLNN